MRIKVGSVFSGIGAFEQALKRMNIEHDVEFACDNGNILIDIDYEKELENVRNLHDITEKKQYVEKLYKEKSRKTNFVKKTYLNNYNINEDRFFNDIKLFDGTDFQNQIDLYVGGSPCQSFSLIGAKAGLDDTRGTLFYDYVRVLQEIKPKVFIFENVYGLFRHDKGNTWKVIQDVFKSIGYHFKHHILDSRDFGIPQGRRRLFVVGFKDLDAYHKFKFPKKLELEYKMQDFLLENLKDGGLINKNSKLVKISNEGQEIEEKYFLSEKLLKYCLSPGTKNFMHKDAKIDLPIARALLATMGNSHRSSVNNYVTTNGRVRALHPRETLRLMGFPDDFKITVSKSQSYRQSGNSIVVDVLIHIIREINIAMGWQ